MHHDWGIIWHLFRGFSKKKSRNRKNKKYTYRTGIISRLFLKNKTHFEYGSTNIFKKNYGIYSENDDDEFNDLLKKF